MKKGLNKILDRVYSSSSSSSRPSVATLDLIIKHSNGDIRSALMSLQFLASNEELSKKATSLGVGGSTAGKGKKRKSDGKEVRKGGREDAKKLYVLKEIFSLLMEVCFANSQHVPADCSSLRRAKARCLSFMHLAKFCTRNVSLFHALVVTSGSSELIFSAVQAGDNQPTTTRKISTDLGSYKTSRNRPSCQNIYVKSLPDPFRRSILMYVCSHLSDQARLCFAKPDCTLCAGPLR